MKLKIKKPKKKKYNHEWTDEAVAIFNYTLNSIPNYIEIELDLIKLSRLLVEVYCNKNNAHKKLDSVLLNDIALHLANNMSDFVKQRDK